ncbi:F-box family protein with DUF295 [Prunus dulcis]|uniref:F-box family protein with DUF295 n=1 Tax=Prunus dulcis TaxID=3755 RepID=A0A4Y1QZP2_PRUDU|nr:F-box family protein with DUF295 [Prunus dulcis]
MTGAIEVRGIHHRASQSFRTTKETLPNFRQKSKGILKRIEARRVKKVICARHSPDVGHAQDLARIPKWKLGRVLS